MNSSEARAMAEMKKLSLDKRKPLAFIYGGIGVAGSFASLLTFNAGIPAMLITGGMILFSASAAFFFLLYLNKVKQLRLAAGRSVTLFEGYKKTHVLWHDFNQLQDELMMNYTFQENGKYMILINSKIKDVLILLKKYLQDLYACSDVVYSFKIVKYLPGFYEDDEAFIKNREKHVDFVACIEDVPALRDPLAPKEYIITKKSMKELSDTLIYQCIKTKRIQIEKKFNKKQKGKAKNRYIGGIVAPVLCYGVPRALICIGSTEKAIFEKEDREIIATYSDAISEYFRLSESYDDLSNAEVIIDYIGNGGGGNSLKLLLETNSSVEVLTEGDENGKDNSEA